MSWTPRSTAKGFTLVEIIVGSLVFAAIIAASFMLINRWQLITARNEAQTAAFEGGRRALGIISQDIRNSYYIYQYGHVTFGNLSYQSANGTPVDPTNFLNGASPNTTNYADNTGDGYSYGGATFAFLPLVTEDFYKTTTTTVPGFGAPQNYPAGFTPVTGPNNTGLGGLATNILTLVATSVVTPTYVCYFKYPGPTSPIVAANDPYKSLYNRLFRVSTDCNFSPNLSQGAWHTQDMHYVADNTASPSIAGMPFPGTATSDVHFNGNGVGWGANCTNCCSPASVRALAILGNDDAASPLSPPATPVFYIQNPHPYSNQLPVSPYYVKVTLWAGDPTNNLLNTGASSPTGSKTMQVMTLNAYAQNVTLPKQE